MTPRRTDDSHRDTRRRFEQWTRNPQCQANVVSAVHNIRMADVAKAEGAKASMGQSPFAIARGQTFEKVLFRNEAEAITKALKKANVLPENAEGFGDLRLRLNGGRCKSLDEALGKTADLLRELASGKARTVPWLVAGATVRVPGGVMLPEAILVLDALVIRHDVTPIRLIVGEIKTYPDRAGYTDSVELATARAQAGVYVHGLDLVIDELGLSSRFEVARQGFLVLSRPGFNQPSIRAGEDLRYQAERAKRGFALLRQTAEKMPPVNTEHRLAAVIAAETHYCESCVVFCDRAEVCRDLAMKSGSGSVLGDDVGRFLGPVTLTRSLELMSGSIPVNPVEEDLVRRIGHIEALKELA
jgi:hypothetical protein